MFRVHITGQKNIPRSGGVILCANHTSVHDGPLIAAHSRRRITFIAKHDFFEKGFFSWLFPRLGVIPVNRDKPSVDDMKRIITKLKDGGVVGIFMQGYIRADGSTDDYKAGVALFAVKGEVPVVPISITSRWRMFSKVRINIGEPISFEEHHGKKVRTAQLNEMAQVVMDEIVRLGERG